MEMNSATPETSNPPNFLDDKKEPLFEPMMSDSMEFLLMQWPINELPDFDGQELMLELCDDGYLGSFTDSYGKEYVLRFVDHELQPTVFQSAKPESKIVGKISQRVVVTHYPDPFDPKKSMILEANARQMYERSGVTVTKNSSHYIGTPKSRISSQKSGVTQSLNMKPSESSKRKSKQVKDRMQG